MCGGLFVGEVCEMKVLQGLLSLGDGISARDGKSQQFLPTRSFAVCLQMTHFFLQQMNKGVQKFVLVQGKQDLPNGFFRKTLALQGKLDFLIPPTGKQ